MDAAHARDAEMLHGFTGLYGASVGPEIRILARIADPLPYGLMGLLCIGVAFSRGRRWTAMSVAVVLVATGATTQALKHLLDQPRYAAWVPWDPMANQWPSGHATAAMTLALCAVMVVPSAWRAVTALVAWGATVGLAYATLALTWHYPSDVLGGYLVAGLWTSLAGDWTKASIIGLRPEQRFRRAAISSWPKSRPICNPSIRASRSSARLPTPSPGTATNSC